MDLPKVDILAFGAHNDDAELGAGGTLLQMKSLGLRTGIISLSKGEMNSRADVNTISAEAKNAAKYLELDVHFSLDLGDSKLEDSYDRRKAIAVEIRKYRPQIVLAPYFDDRHRDHAIAGNLVKGSNLLARLKKLPSEYEPFGPKLFLFYFLQARKSVAPTLIIDITSHWEAKQKLIKIYESQFSKNADEHGIISIGISDYMFHIESRDRYFGSLIDCKYGEAFYCEEPISISDWRCMI